MPRIARLNLAALSLLIAAGTAQAAPLAMSGTSPAAAAQLIHLKPGRHCHPHGHGKLCHGANDYPALYGLLDRKLRTPSAPHRHTRLCQH